MVNEMLLIALSGPSGTGKTTLAKKLAFELPVISNKYMELNKYSLDNTLVISKWAYINYWFNQAISNAKDGNTIVVSDRSPIDTCFYANNGTRTILPPLTQSIDELNLLGIKLYHILISCDIKDAKKRISKRLKIEPERKQYHESSMDFIENIYEKYHRDMDYWDATINTSLFSVNEACEKIRKYIKLWSDN